ncbi:(Dimethylallyl)adenosine tRNA methylthiotransferase MiaB [Propionispora sp. 2/2-37]|uniref:tRNA (N6-isopentenyl adenosine(37)-C2)-methylthiotransferase MiaB n=1 Tax=Propionispora sp. 2/2-37 TaxID=1677858 RepID=UPI0006C5E492|nr:tRNA (N6-isopentenyl adenosine(37)-C2)-methylthiotransferase MiaB [Propionispora sp. 2/2-37]CUH94179.1 (Dimethylallyl)adenosine tRNA methylthiotransferase MiaB [Propionispora sp. 2/2-37]
MTDRIENDVDIDGKNQCQKFMCILTYGCQMNENDSERFAGQLKTAGYQFTDKLDQADLIIINTCCVRESAEKKIYGKIGELKKLKAVNPNLLIGIAGCMAQKDQEKIFKKASHIDFIIGTHNVHKLAELIAEVENKKEKVLAVWEQAEQMAPDVPTVHKGQVSAYVPIMYGCNNFCTYCIVPYVRGRERSRSVEDILREINQLAADGFKEVTLLGQNVNSYGKDKQETQGFARLLEAVDRSSAVERIRYMTSHPRDMNDAVIDVISQSTKICEHFHLPIQSGSDKILEKMNRGYSTEYYLSLMKKIREAVPNASITTDIIVGFPGETEELFLETIQLLKEIRFDAAYTFIYSQRSGTPAAAMPGQVPLAEKKARLQRLMTMQNDISLDINQSLQGQTLEVLVEGPSKNDETRWMGRTRTNKIVLWDKKGTEKVGQLLPVYIVNAQTWLLKGQLLS